MALTLKFVYRRTNCLTIIPTRNYFFLQHEDQIVRYKEEGKKLKKYYLSKDNMTCPKGWVCEAWEVDTLTRKVDKDGE